MNISKASLWWRALILGFSLSLCVVPAHAVHELGVFELDGDAADDAGVDGDDWQNIYDKTDSSNATTGVLADPSPLSIFTGGRKDIQDITQWSHKDGSVPDKDDLTNAYAAAYGVDNSSGGKDLVIYFGADRFANVGDAYIGFWFFQDQVEAMPDGSFSGVHKEGDVLILVDYPQGANESPYAALLVWDTTCNKAASNDPIPEECAAKNLRLKAESSDEVSAECGVNDSDDNGCAITNSDTTDSFWPYLSKSGASNFPFESFYEGGVNLTELLSGTNTCFSSFMAETRSSSSFTASLKDFVIGDFELCGIDLSKTCTGGTLSTTGDSIIYNYTVKVTNTGFGSIHDINIKDITANDDYYLELLGAGESEERSGTLETQINGVLNQASVSAALVAGGTVEINDTAEFKCPTIPDPGILSISKECETLINRTSGGQYGVLVKYKGKVCNDSLVKINGVSITENHDNKDTTISVGDIGPKSCKDYNGEYVPVPPAEENLPLPAHDVRTFTDTVVAKGTTAIFGLSVDSGLPVSAECPLCVKPE
jgi:hypothetical protein